MDISIGNDMSCLRLKNSDNRFSKETGLPVHIADDPLACVAIGKGQALDQEETFSSILSEY